MSMYENCIMKAKKIQITEASKNNMYVELKKKELILLPHHKEAIERLVSIQSEESVHRVMEAL